MPTDASATASMWCTRLLTDEDEPSVSGAGCNGWMDFSGTQQTNAARVNTTDPEGLPVCKSRDQFTVLASISHRKPLECDVKVTVADGIAIRDAALEMGTPIVILAVDRGCDVQGIPAGNGRGHRPGVPDQPAPSRAD